MCEVRGHHGRIITQLKYAKKCQETFYKWDKRPRGEHAHTDVHTESLRSRLVTAFVLFGVEKPHKGKTNVLNGCLTS